MIFGCPSRPRRATVCRRTCGAARRRAEQPMSLRDNELARREDGRVELRPRPLRVRWTLGELRSADGHELRANFTCSARALPDATERRMLEEILLGSRYAVSDDDLSRH